MVPINLSKAIKVYKKSQASLGEFISDLEMESLGYCSLEDTLSIIKNMCKVEKKGETK